MRRPGGNWSVGRIDKAENYQTVLYEVDMLRFSCSRIIKPPDGAKEADVWAYLESFLVHYRNLLDFFGKAPRKDGTDLSITEPHAIWSTDAGTESRRPPEEIVEKLRAVGESLWNKYENGTKRDDTISRYLQHCTTYRLSPKHWYPIEMMKEIEEILAPLEQSLPEFKPATTSHLIERDRFLGGNSVSTHSGPSGRLG